MSNDERKKPDDRDDRDERAHAAPPPSADERLRGLLAALTQLQQYLDERGSHTYELAQRFMANAKRDPSARAYDERQATMLEYQHYIWKEIAGRVGQVRAVYDDAPAADAGSPSPPNASAKQADAGEG